MKQILSYKVAFMMVVTLHNISFTEKLVVANYFAMSSDIAAQELVC